MKTLELPLDIREPDDDVKRPIELDGDLWLATGYPAPRDADE